MNQPRYVFFINGLRAYAIIGVVAIHYLFLYKHLLVAEMVDLIKYGLYGVHLFFIISGYCIVQSYSKINYIDFLHRRFKRIAPAYYVVIILFFCLNYFFSITTNNFSNFHLYDALKIIIFFTFWSKNESILGAYGTLGIEWSLGVEAFFYLFIPLLTYFLKNKLLLLLLFSISLIILILLKIIATYISSTPNLYLMNTLAVFHFPIAFLINFSSGMIAFKLRNFYKTKQKILVLISIIFILFAFKQFFHLSTNVKLCVFMIFFITFVSDKNYFIRILFNNKIIQHIGNLSYSIYLYHIFSLLLIKKLNYDSINTFLLSLLLTYLLSYISFKYVENFFRFHK